MTMTEQAAVLFLCNRNAIRSPMAAALLASQGGAAESAGIVPGEADSLTGAVLEEMGLGLPASPRPVDDLKLGHFGLIVALSPQAQHRALEMTRNLRTPVEFWAVSDPAWWTAAGNSGWRPTGWCGTNCCRRSKTAFCRPLCPPRGRLAPCRRASPPPMSGEKAG